MPTQLNIIIIINILMNINNKSTTDICSHSKPQNSLFTNAYITDTFTDSFPT